MIKKKTTPKPKTIKFIVVNGEYICSYSDFCLSDWDSSAIFDYYEFIAPPKRELKFTQVKVA